MEREIIALGKGQPDSNLLPVDIIGAVLKEDPLVHSAKFLQYGSDPGDPDVIDHITEFLRSRLGLQNPQQLTSKHIGLTAGVSHGVDLVCGSFLNPGDVILVENPTYYLILNIFRSRHLKIVEVDTSPTEGISIEDLEKKIALHQPKAIYTIPAHHNPLSVNFSEQSRQQIVDVCSRNKVLIFADETYQFLTFPSYSGDAPRSLALRSPWVVSLSSVTKILSPGMRTGWVVAHPDLIEQFSRNPVLASGGSICHFSSGVVLSLLKRQEDLFGGYIDLILQEYEKRCQALSAALSEHVPEGQFHRPQGGYFIWLKLPGVDADKFLNICEAHGVDFKAGNRSAAETLAFTNYMRLCFTHYEESKLKEGARRLGLAYRDYMKKHSRM